MNQTSTFHPHPRGTRLNMSSSKDKDKDNAAWTRATEVNEAMLGLQPYADDSMFFIARYSHKAQVHHSPYRIRSSSLTNMQQMAMRAKDYTDFMNTFGRLMELWTKPAEAAGGPVERSRRAAEIREHSKSLVKGFPELERDFDQFVTASRATLRAFHADQL